MTSDITEVGEITIKLSKFTPFELQGTANEYYYAVIKMSEELKNHCRENRVYIPIGTGSFAYAAIHDLMEKSTKHRDILMSMIKSLEIKLESSSTSLKHGISVEGVPGAD